MALPGSGNGPNHRSILVPARIAFGKDGDGGIHVACYHLELVTLGYFVQSICELPDRGSLRCDFQKSQVSRSIRHMWRGTFCPQPYQKPEEKKEQGYGYDDCEARLQIVLPDRLLELNALMSAKRRKRGSCPCRHSAANLARSRLPSAEPCHLRNARAVPEERGHRPRKLRDPTQHALSGSDKPRPTARSAEVGRSGSLSLKTVMGSR